MTRRVPSVPVAAFGLLVLLAGSVAACGSGSLPTTSASTAPASASASAASPSTPASASRASLPPATTVPGSPTDPPMTSDAPPSASLVTADGAAVTGDLGAFTWYGLTSDGPWVIGNAVVRPASGEPLTVRFAGAPATPAWRARIARIEDGKRGTPAALGEGTTGVPVAFAAPTAGSWTVELTLDYVDFGDATWYWRLDVPG